MVLFLKEKSSLQSTSSEGGNKKGKDVAMRKSDRRGLLQRVLDTFALGTHHGAKEGTDDDDDDGRHEKQRTQHQQLLHHIFLQGDLFRRTLIDPKGNNNGIQQQDKKSSMAKVVVYYRGPSSEASHDTSPQEIKESACYWPYEKLTQAVWIELDDGRCQLPTVGLLSAFYQQDRYGYQPTSYLPLLPTIVVFPQVSKYVCRGADLMKAGIASVFIPEQHRNKAIVAALCIQGNVQPFAVGFLDRSMASSSEQGEEGEVDVGPGTQGIAVRIQTTYGDDLWKQQFPTSGDNAHRQSTTTVSSFDDGNYGNPGFVDGQFVAPIIVSSHEEGTLERKEEEESLIKAETDCDQCPDGYIETDEPQQTADDVLHQATCKALAHLHPKRDLPLNMAQFYSQYVLKHRPEGTTVELKKTRYKKFGPYVQEQVDRGLITVGPDASKKDPLALLLGYDPQHDDLIPFIRQHKEEQREENQKQDSTTRRLALAELYIIPNHFVDLLRLDKKAVKAANATSDERRNTGFLTSKEARAILDEYIEREDLVNPTNKGQILLNGPLTDALYKQKSKKVEEMASPPPTTVTRKQVAATWQSRLETAFALVEMPGSRVIQLGRGNPPKVTIEVSRRQSKKFVTKLRGMEHYNIDALQLRQELAQRFACAATVDENPTDYKLPKNHVELQLQGNMVDEVEALLVGDESLSSHGGVKNSSYHLPPNAIDVVMRKGVPARKKRAPTKKS